MGYADFWRLVQKGAVVTFAIFLIKFAYDVATILSLNIFESKLPYSYPIRNTNHRLKVILQFHQNCLQRP